jgi:hypothetical protein
MSDANSPKPPKLVEVLFNQAWRGHSAGTVVELTEERAAELLAGKVCELTTGLKPQDIKAKIAAAEKEATEAKAAAKTEKAKK